MTTVSQVQQAVFQGVFQDQMSAGANAAADAMNNLGTAAETTDTKVTRAGKSASALVNAYDPLTRSANQLATAKTTLAKAEGTLSAAVAGGSKSQEQMNAAMAALQARVAAAQATVDALAEAQSRGASTAELLAISQGRAVKSSEVAISTNRNLATALRGVTVQATDVFQQLATGAPVMTTFIQQGAQVYQQAQVMGIGFGQLAKSVGGFVVSLVAAHPIIATVTAIAGATVALGVASESAQRQLAGFQNTLRATRDDYVSLAQASLATAKTFAATSTAGTADAIAAAKAITSAQNFSGNQGALKDLLALSNDLATVWGKTLPEAAKELADAMKDPAAEAQKLSDQGFRGFNQQLADQVKLLQAAGDKAEAFRAVQDGLAASARGASIPQTALGKALSDLSNAFTSAGQNGRSLADALGSVITEAAALAIRAITGVVNAINALRSLVPGSGGPLPGASLGSTSSLVVSPSTQLRTDIANQIYSTAEAKNFGGTPELSALQADFATRVAYQESRGDQSAVSKAGAVGVMGLMPATAAGLGVNPSDQGQNIQGGLQYIAQLWSKYGGNPTLVAMAYNWGPGNVDAFLAGNKTLGQVPVETQSYVKAITGGDIASISAGRGLSGANAGGLGTLPLSVPSVASAAVGGPGALTDQLNAALKFADGLDTIAGKQKALAAEAKQLRDALAIPGQTQDTYDKLSQGLDIVKGRQATLRTATEEVNKQLSDQASIAGQDGAAAQKIAETMLQLDNASIAATGHVASLSEKQAALASISQALSAELSNNVRQTERQIAANDNSLAATQKGGQALDDYNAIVKAQTEALAFAAKGTEQYNTALVVLTASNQNLARSQRDVQAATDLSKTQQQMDMLRLEDQLIGATVEQRNREIAVMQERQKLGLQIGEEATATQQKELDAVAALADLQTHVLSNKQALSDVASAFTTAFDTIGNAITNALLQGQGAAVNWRNVMLSVAQQVLQAFLKFAILNPILNSLFGQNNTTAGGILGAFGSMGGGSSSSGGGFGINDLLTVGGAADKLTGGGISSSLTDWLGLKDTLSSVKSFFGFGNGSSGISSILNSGLFGTSTAEAALAAATPEAFGAAAGGLNFAPLAAQTASGASGATGILGGASIGSLAGGFGAGFGAGSLAGGFVQSSLGKTGPGPQVGAAAGAAIGTAAVALAPETFGISLIVGGILGGLLGGAGGGLIGPKAPTPFSVTNVGVDENGQFILGSSAQQKADSNRTPVSDTLNAINELLRAYGVRTTGSYGQYLGTVGSTNAAGGGRFEDPRQITSLTSFEAPNNPNLNRLLQGHGGGFFPDAGELEQFLTKFGAEQKAITDFLAATTTSLAGLNQVTGTFNEQINAITQSFNPAIDGAKQLEGLWSTSTDQLAQLTKAEQDLTAARDAAIKKAQDAVYGGLGDQINQIYMQTAQSAAQRSGDPGQIRDVALWQTDYQEWQKKKAVYDQFQATFGSGGWTQEAINLYMQAQDAVEKQFGEQRLTIQKTYNDQLLALQKQGSDAAAEAAAGVISNITDYLHKFQVGGDSPLSPQAQYDLASNQFNAVSGAAIAGDFNSAQQFTSYADALAGSARSLYGSGAGYAEAVGRIVNAGGQIGAQGADALTASVMRSETRTQTQVLGDKLDGLRAEVASLRGALQQVAAQPAQRAA